MKNEKYTKDYKAVARSVGYYEVMLLSHNGYSITAGVYGLDKAFTNDIDCIDEIKLLFDNGVTLCLQSFDLVWRDEKLQNTIDKIRTMNANKYPYVVTSITPFDMNITPEYLESAPLPRYPY